MMKTVKVFSFLLLGAALLCNAGCPKKLPEGMPALNPTTITVTVAGQPIKGATVSLFPTAGEFKGSLGGSTDDAGVVKIYANGEFEGAPEGEMTVCVKKIETDEDGNATNAVSEDYSSPDISELKVTIKKGKNAETIDIPSAE